MLIKLLIPLLHVRKLFWIYTIIDKMLLLHQSKTVVVESELLILDNRLDVRIINSFSRIRVNLASSNRSLHRSSRNICASKILRGCHCVIRLIGKWLSEVGHFLPRAFSLSVSLILFLRVKFWIFHYLNYKFIICD